MKLTWITKQGVAAYKSVDVRTGKKRTNAGFVLWPEIHATRKLLSVSLNRITRVCNFSGEILP